MFNENQEESKAKVTISCRVLPRQKLLIAKRAKEMDMSVSQYVEAKVLEEDIFELEQKIENQRLELENLKLQLSSEKERRINELKETKRINDEKIKALEKEIEQLKTRKEHSYSFHYTDAEGLSTFKAKLKKLAKKYELDSNLSALMMCVEYTLSNDKYALTQMALAEYVKNRKDRF